MFHLLCRYLPWTLGGALIISVVAFLIVDTQHQRQRMISLLGAAIILILAGLFSQKHRRIKLRLVGFSMTFNFLLCLISFRYPTVADAIGCLLEKSQSLLRIPQFGATFLLGHHGFIPNYDNVLARRMVRSRLRTTESNGQQA